MYTVMSTKKRLSEYEVEGLDGFTLKSFENQRRQRESDGAVNERFPVIGKLAATSEFKFRNSSVKTSFCQRTLKRYGSLYD